MIKQLAERVDPLVDSEAYAKNADAAGLILLRETQPTQFEASIYEPIVCLILQGQKVTTVGGRTLTLSPGQSIVVSHPLPVLSRITQASERRPYLSMVIRLDIATLRGLYDELEDLNLDADSGQSIEVAEVEPPTLNVLSRYLDLLSDPTEARVLLPLVRKELHYRLYRSESGGMLRSLLHRDSHASSIARAIQTLRQTYRDRLEVAELARSVGMSASSFHKHFKSVTLTTPLQYQKDLRLTEARELLRAGRSTVSGAAFAVGYESASQFTREYSRKFGAPPRVDLSVA